MIYDREGSEAFLDYLKNKEVHILESRGESINLFVLIKTIVKHGLRVNLEKYQAEYIKLVSPKIIITFIVDCRITILDWLSSIAHCCPCLRRSSIIFNRGIRFNSAVISSCNE